MRHVDRDEGRVKSPTTHPQREMEQAARRFMAAVERVIDLSQINRIILDRSHIGAIYADDSIGIIGDYREARP